jgi:hypothetical protein
MFKISLLLFIIINILFSKEVHFNETKYIYALDNTFNKVGSLNIQKNKVTLHYNNSDKNIIYSEENIQIITEDSKEVFTHEESIEYNLFFQLVLGVYTNNTTLLNENFTIKKSNHTTTLIPNEYLSSVIKNIEYEKDNEKLKYLKINFVNQDRITIEEIE